MNTLSSKKSSSLNGQIEIPGDKSISHRSIIIGSLAIGETVIEGLLESDDVICTINAVRSFGAKVFKTPDGLWRVSGRGIGGFDEANCVLDLGNSGTGVRLLMGLAAGNPFNTFFTGDSSLSERPMDRVTIPLNRMGANFISRAGGRLPIVCSGPETLLPICYSLPVASAQVKSAILLAALSAPGKTSIIEPKPTRDHTETMLKKFGAKIKVEKHGEGGQKITLTGEPELKAQKLHIPGDPSSAAFPAVAALIVDGSKIRLPNIGINPLRFGLFETLREMGANIQINRLDYGADEPIADLTINSSRLVGIDIPPDIAPRMIDEYPILAIAAAFAHGTTIMNGLAELRVKESDRLSAIANGLSSCGVKIEESEDRLVIHGNGGTVVGGGKIKTNFDHRIAMAFLVLGMAAESPVVVDDATAIDTSFPSFSRVLRNVGANLSNDRPNNT